MRCLRCRNRLRSKQALLATRLQQVRVKSGRRPWSPWETDTANLGNTIYLILEVLCATHPKAVGRTCEAAELKELSY